MITAEAAAESAVSAVPEAADNTGGPEREELVWPWVSSSPSGNRHGVGGAGPRAPFSCPSPAPRPIERCPDPGAGTAHPPVAG